METNKTTNLIFATARGTLAALLVLVLVIAGVIYGAWWAMSHVPETAAQAWAMLATLAIPAALWLGIRIGNGKTRAWLAGIDAGLEQVTKAAAQISQAGAESASLRGQTAATIRRATQPEPEMVVELPKLEAHYRVMEALPSGEEVNL